MGSNRERGGREEGGRYLQNSGLKNFKTGMILYIFCDWHFLYRHGMKLDLFIS
jgi:hypothetical protein